MDEDQVRIYALLTDVFVKLMLSVCAAAIFVAFAIALIVNPNWPIAVVETFFGGTVFAVFRHYFPSKD